MCTDNYYSVLDPNFKECLLGRNAMFTAEYEKAAESWNKDL